MRSIVQVGNPVLREVAKDVPIADIHTKEIRSLIADMKSLLAKEEYGVALAAPQVGESLRLFVVSGAAILHRKRSDIKENNDGDYGGELDGMPEEDELYINPVLTKVSRKRLEKHEGCLSVRGKWGMVLRAEKATITALDANGKKVVRGASGFLAHIFQHEMDHLNGILYTDKTKDVFDDTHE